MKITRTQATIISDLVALVIEAGWYNNLDDARRDFVEFFQPTDDRDLFEGPRRFSIRDLTREQADHLIMIYRHMHKMPHFAPP